MYENLEPIARLKFNKEMEDISARTREKVRKAQNQYVTRTAGASVRSGQHEASIGRMYIESAEELGRYLYQTWVDLIQRRNGHLSRRDLSFVVGKIREFAATRKVHLRQAFGNQGLGAALNPLREEADRRMDALTSSASRDLEILVREQEELPQKTDEKTGRPAEVHPELPRTRHFANVLNILIASPSDVAEEREVVTRTIYEWNAAHFSATGILLNPVKWESHSYPASGDRPQAIVNKQIVESGDILIGIFGHKLGTPTGVAQSGTIEEIEEFRTAGKYVALYFSTADVPRSADRAQLEALESYQRERQKDTLFFTFSDPRALHDHLTGHLPKIVQELRRQLRLVDPEPGPEPTSPPRVSESPVGVVTRASPLLADVISELEDNLDRASRPRAGDAYRRPSNRAWLENRNKVTVPAETQARVKAAYDQIGSWSDILSTGLHPDMGSVELNMIVSGLRLSLPPLIDELRRLNSES